MPNLEERIREVLDSYGLQHVTPILISAKLMSRTVIPKYEFRRAVREAYREIYGDGKNPYRITPLR